MLLAGGANVGAATSGNDADRADNAASGYVGRTFRIDGHIEDGYLRAERVQWRAAREPGRVQISGQVRALDMAARRFRLGRNTIEWREEADIRELRPGELRDGAAVRVTGQWDDDRIVASRIRATEPMAAEALQIVAVVDEAERLPSGITRLSVGDVEVLWPMSGFNTVESLIRRQDQRGSDNPVTRQLLGRDFGLTGKAEFGSRERRHFDLEGQEARIDAEAAMEFGAFYRLSPNVTIYAAAKANYAADVVRSGGTLDPPVARLERDQSWIYLQRIGGSGFGLQLGRQNFKEAREWWWDDDLDAARVYYDRGPFHAEFGWARELAPLSNKDEGIDPAQRGVTRSLANAAWLWGPRQKLELFFVHAADRSQEAPLGSVIPATREDPSDAQLTWFGVRASGTRELGSFGALIYWADHAWLTGRDRQIDYADVPAGLRIDGVRDVNVRGSGLDVGFSWQAPWRYPLSLGLGFARGSGGGTDPNNSGFRQTGLHRNKARSFGVNRYRSYGEVLRPELSNLAVQTATLGLPFRRNSSLELAWHRYRQPTPTDSLRDARIDANLTGMSGDVGSALDLIAGFRDSRSVDVAVAVGFFRAGEAFGVKKGAVARQITLDLTWNF